MSTKTLTLTAAVCLALAASAWAQQLMVYDAHGKKVGRYESNGAPLNGNLVPINAPYSFGEAAIRQVNGVWLALPISSLGFTGTASHTQSEWSDIVTWSGPNCTGTPYLDARSDTEVGVSGDEMQAAPLVQNAVVVAGVAYYVLPSEYERLATSNPVTVCSQQFTNGPCTAISNGRFAECIGVADLLAAQTVTLSTLGFTPPFSIR